jgi:putative NAD(P)-binding protein
MAPLEAEPKSRDARIAIVGAGPAGLSAAWFLKRQGFTNVVVFERYGRVGGLCFTLNDGYRAFDLGGNYVTPAYRETRRIARAVGARTFRAEDHVAWRPKNAGDAAGGYVDIATLVRERRDAHGDPTGVVGWLRFGWAVLRYVYERWNVRGVIDQPSFAEVHTHPELCVGFGAWLRTHGLDDLRSMFEIPVTMMGYGFLDDVAAPYVLKYMSLGTFLAMCLREAPYLGWLCPWPRRFEFGFQRMWEAVGWRLNVRTDVAITGIWRYGDPPPADGLAPSAAHPIRIDLTHPATIFARDVRSPSTRWFDHLIVASSRVGALAIGSGRDDVFHVEPGGREERLFQPVETYDFCMTTMHP